MKFKSEHKILGLLLIASLVLSCQSIQSSFGKFNINTNREAMLTTIGYEDKALFESDKFISFATIQTEKPLQVHIKSDSIKLCKKQQLKFDYKEAQVDSLAKLKKPVTVISIFNKQDLIEQINAQVDLTARPNLAIVTEIILKNQSGFDDLVNADTKYFQFNSSQNAYELIYYKEGIESSLTINSDDILGYKSLFLCCTYTFGELKVTNLSEGKCPSKSFKTLKNKTKTENYERF